MADQSDRYHLWLQQCAQGNSTALQQLYQTEGPRLMALGLSLLQRQNDAEELVRETCVLIWHNADAYDVNLGSAQAWIYSIFRFRAQQRLKHSSVTHTVNCSQLRLLIPSDAPTDLQQYRHLDSTSRKMITVAYLHGLSYAEIAKACQSNIEKTKIQIEQALKDLSGFFSGWKTQSSSEHALLGAYGLGLLRDSTETNQAHQLLNTNSDAPHDVLLWESIFSALVYTLPIQTPPTQLLHRIFNDLGLKVVALPESQSVNQATPTKITRFDTPVTTSPNPAPNTTAQSVQAQPTPAVTNPKTPLPIKSSTHNLTTNTPITNNLSQPTKKNRLQWTTTHWIITAIVIALLALVGWAFMPKAPIIQMIQMSPQAGAILQAPGQSSTPGWIVSVDPEGHVLLNPQVRTDIGPNQQVQLWTQSSQNSPIRSLGLINPNQPVTVPAELIGPISIGQIFEMTIEPTQGSSTPTGTVLFIGRIVKFGEFDPTASAT